jgi:outer membrane protein assembly factor BamB
MAKRRRMQTRQSNYRTLVWGVSSCICGLVLAWLAGPALFRLTADAQPAVRLLAPAGGLAEKAKAGDEAAESMKDPAEEKFPGGAPLKTDPEQQRLLKRAEICVADGRFDLATVLWQKVLDEAGDILMTRDGRFYTSLSEEVERAITSLPPEALRTYRLTADGQAELILAKANPNGEEDALAEVVRRYFLSAVGDDAAYKLACLALDRHDFVGASRLLAKIIEQHPDPSMPISEVLLRLSVASARMGDKEAAGKWLTKYATASGERPSSEVFDLVLEDVKKSTQAAIVSGQASENWPMLLGSSSRVGHMRSTPSEATAKTLTEAWVYEFPLATGESSQNNPWGVAMGAMGLHGHPFTLPGQPGRNVALLPREPLVTAWRQNHWMPTAQLLFDKGLVIIKTADELFAFNAAAVESGPVWKSFTQNEYVLDGQTADLMRMSVHTSLQQSGNAEPRSVAEIFLFGDRIHQSMSLYNGIVYSVEGKTFDGMSPTIPGQSLLAKPWQWNVSPRRTRSNFLAAYHARTGKLIGRRAASDEDKEGSTDVGFLGAPIGFGNLILVPVTDGGAIWLYAMEEARQSDDQKCMTTVWKTYLCDEPSEGVNPWASIVPALDGRDLYLCCGTGVVFAVDAVSGQVRWAIRYQRTGKPDQRMRNFGNLTARKKFSEWEDDVVVPHGRALIVMASDSDQLMAIDRRTGQLLWESPRTSSLGTTATYCLGVSGNNLYVGGRDVVRCYAMSGGKLKWEKPIDGSYGHGCLTADAIYVPVKDSVLKLDPATGKEMGQVGVALPTDDPVGNVYSDGQKLWVAGGARVYAMTSLDHRLNILAQQIAAGDPEAQLTRMRLMFKDNKLEAALSDLKGAYQLFRQKLTPDDSASRLFFAMHELKLPQEKPLIALGVLEEFFVKSTPPPLSSELKSRRGDLLLNAMRAARQAKVQNLAPAVLKLAPLFDTDYLVQTAAATIQATATRADVEVLTSAVTGDQPQAQAAAIGALAKLAGADAKEPLLKALESGDDRVKLASARALANLGERQSLKTFVQLLSSENSRTRLRSHQSLRALSGKNVMFLAEAKPEDRAKAIEEWKTWVETEGQTAKLAIPLPETDQPLGRTLFVSYGHSTVIEIDADHKERWRARVMNPWACQGLPNGHRLVAGFAQGQMSVIEFDEEGREVWRKDKLPAIPYSVQRLENGNTLVACRDSQQIIEIFPDKSTKAIQVQGNPMYAQRLENGNTLIALQRGSRVVEMDPNNSIVWEARNMDGPCFCQRLENGNTLVVQMHTGRVVEVDPTGQKTVWTSKIPLVNPISAQRLSNGNTLIADNTGLTEVDPTGQIVKWRYSQNNVTGVSHF